MIRGPYFRPTVPRLDEINNRATVTQPLILLFWCSQTTSNTCDFFGSWVFGDFKLSITVFRKIRKIRDRYRRKALVETNLSVPVSYFSDFYEESYGQLKNSNKSATKLQNQKNRAARGSLLIWKIDLVSPLSGIGVLFLIDLVSPLVSPYPLL